MDTKDLQFLDRLRVNFAGQNNKVIMVLVCTSKEIAEKLQSILMVNLFRLDVRISKEGIYSVEIVFIDEEDIVLRINTGLTKDEYPQLNYLSTQKVDFITTGYKDDQDNWQLSQPYKPLENLIHLN